MGVLPDCWIERMARTHRMIRPCAANRVRPGKVSYGLSSYGYDFRLADEFKIPEIKHETVLDPKFTEELRFAGFKGKSCAIAPSSFVLGRSLEFFRIPRDVLAICFGKSTYARCGLVVNVTPLEPEWEGFITISLVNATASPIRVHAGEGIGQAVFLRAEEECGLSYAERRGKYQGQNQIQPAKL